MRLVKNYLYIMLAFMVLCGLWAIYSTYSELRGFKDQVLDQQARLLQSVRQQETDLQNALTNISDKAHEDARAIDRAYTALLDKRRSVYHSAAAGRSNMPAVTSTTKEPRPNTPAKSLAPCGGVSKQLYRCEQRLIYEAREFDILATHYNALLTLYKHAQGVQNDNNQTNKGEEDSR